jgi:site-specific DNA recombinase
VALQVERIVLRSRYIDITLRGSASPEGQGPADPSSPAPTTLHLPWTPTSASARKGITWKPSAQANLDPATSEALLIAIARARSWMNDLTEGRVNSFEAIARSENKVERHIRRLIPLAFVSPRIVEAIANGSAPADLTVTSLTSALPRSWSKQEKRYGIVCPIARRGPEMT